MLFKRTKKDGPAACAICGLRPGVARIADGHLCQTCVPVNARFDMPTSREVLAFHVADPELIERIETFEDSEVIGDLHFDDAHRLFFKGPYPNRCIPVLSYSEIVGYRVIINGSLVAFDSIDGERSVFRITTDDYIRKASKEAEEIVLELDSGRGNVSFIPYPIRTMKARVAESREECLRAAIAISRRLDAIVEENIRTRDTVTD